MATRLSGTYVALHQKKEPHVGLGVLLLAALAALAVYVWPRPGVGGPARTTADVLFERTMGLTAGDPVMAAGVRVGEVTWVKLEDVGRVRVRLEVEERFRPMRDATARVLALNLLGDRYVAYAPGTAPAPLPAKAAILGTTAEDGAVAYSGLLDSARAALRGVTALAAPEARDELAATRAAIDGALEAVTGLRDEPAIADARAALEAARSAAGRLDAVLAEARPDSARVAALQASLADLRSELARASRAVDGVLERVDSGDGTLGRLTGDSAIRANLAVLRQMVRRRR